MLMQSFAASFRCRRFLLTVVGVLCAALGAWAQETRSVPAQTAPSVPDTGGDDAAPLAYVLMTTSKGDIAIELYRSHAPISVDNFLKYVDSGYYEGTIFHRVITAFMVQGGGYTADMEAKPGLLPSIKNEWQNGLANRRGTLAMARLGRQPDSATSQFFINVVDNAFLDEPRDGAGYAVFGQVIAGMSVVDAIRAAPVGVKNGMGDVPNETIAIERVRRITQEEAAKLAAADKAATPAPQTPPASRHTPPQPPATRPAQP